MLYLGRVMESAKRDALYARPLRSYMQVLLSALLIPDPKQARQRRTSVVRGEPPSPLDPPSGGVFRTRCPNATERCAAAHPALREADDDRVACHHAETLAAQRAKEPAPVQALLRESGVL